MWDLIKFRDRIAVIDEYGNRFSYQKIQEDCVDFFKQINHRCLVMIFCTNTIGSLVGYISCLNNLIVPIMVDSELNQELLVGLIDKYKPEYYWLPNEKCFKVQGSKIYESYAYSLVKSVYKDCFPLFQDLALLLTTSGSTGSPKLVRQSYKNIESNAEAIVGYLKLNDEERPITTLPMNYTYGLSIINSHLFVGATIIITSKTLLQREFWQLFKAYRATSFGGVPYTYELLEKLRFFKMDLPSLKTMTQAGGKLSTELHKKFAEYAEATGRSFVVMYGQTEATARMAYLPPENALKKCGSVGIAIPHGQFRLLDMNDCQINDPNVVGELEYLGPNVMLGYAEAGDDLIKGDELCGILKTGDMAKFDSDGYYYIVGRKKRFLKIFGSRINLDETEQLIKSHFPTDDCAIGGVDDRMYIFTNGSNGEAIIRFLSKTMEIHKSAFHLICLKEIPRNQSGKILYNVLAGYYQ